MVKIGIYKYTNKINGKIYIGQSTNIKRRYGQHLYDATYRPKMIIDKAIAKYGIENFTFEIIEECDSDILNEREKYWIQYYNSYKEGYNCTIGGDSLKGSNHPRALLTEEDVWIIREMYKNKISRREVFEIFKDTGISPRGFKKVWDNETWSNIHGDVYTEENKEWHKKNTGHSEDQLGLSSLDRALSQKEIDKIYQDFQNGLNIYQLSQKYNRDCGTIQCYISQPIAKTKISYKGRKLKNINTGIIFPSISKAAKWASCGATTLTRHLCTDKIAGIVPDTNESAQWEEIF